MGQRRCGDCRRDLDRHRHVVLPPGAARRGPAIAIAGRRGVYQGARATVEGFGYKDLGSRTSVAFVDALDEDDVVRIRLACLRRARRSAMGRSPIGAPASRTAPILPEGSNRNPEIFRCGSTRADRWWRSPPDTRRMPASRTPTARRAALAIVIERSLQKPRGYKEPETAWPMRIFRFRARRC